MLLIVRHGKTVVSTSRILQGGRPADAQSRQRAEKFRWLWARLTSCPPRGGLEKQQNLWGCHSLDERWIELDYGEWDELPITELR